tara:strand:- start:86 stop:244 length:159 start_codon:yes stop_codon:yes gene_type:complete
MARKRTKNGSKMKRMGGGRMTKTRSRMGGGRMMTKTRSRGGALRRRSGGRAR